MCNFASLMIARLSARSNALSLAFSRSIAQRIRPMAGICCLLDQDLRPTPNQVRILTSRLEHRVLVLRGLWNRLKDVPVLDDLAVLIESENIDPRPVAVAWPVLEAVKDNVVALGNHPAELHPLAGVLSCHALEIRDERGFAVSHHRV